jgi:pyruvate/2-oxoglutarate dehydrogenase complex dihydrolipoamide acyltransferase (E2) component
MKQTRRDDCWLLRAPRLNANDDSVMLTRWLAADGATVAAGAPLAEIETEKATAELAAEVGGTLLHAVATGTQVPIGTPLGLVGLTLAEAEEMRRMHAQPHAPGEPATVRHRKGARAAARVRGRLGDARERRHHQEWMARHLAERGAAGLRMTRGRRRREPRAPAPRRARSAPGCAGGHRTAGLSART